MVTESEIEDLHERIASLESSISNLEVEFATHRRAVERLATRAANLQGYWEREKSEDEINKEMLTWAYSDEEDAK